MSNIEYTYEKEEIALGLTWRTLDGTNKRQVLNDLPKKTDTFGLFVDVNDEANRSTVTQFASSLDNATAGKYSGAAILAAISDNLIFVDRINDELFWVVAISNGQVLADGDLLCDKDSADNAIKHFEGIYIDADCEYTFLFTEECQRASFHSKGMQVSFAEIIEKAEVSNFRKQFSKYKVKKLGRNNTPILLAAGIVLCGGVYLALFYQQKTLPTVQTSYVPQIVNRVPLVSKPKAPQQEDLLEAAYEEEVEWFNAEFKQSNVSRVIRSMLEYYTSTENHVAGWERTGFSYSRKKPNHIKVLWNGTRYGTAITFRNAEIERESVSFNRTMSKAFSMHKIDATPMAERLSLKSPIEYINKQKYKEENLTHDLSMLGFNWTLSDHIVTLRKKPILGVTERLTKKPQLNMLASDLVLNGQRFEGLLSVIYGLSLTNTFVLDTVTVGINGSAFDWRVTGIVYNKEI